MDWVVSYPKSGNTWTRLVSRVYSYGNPMLEGFGRAGDLEARIFHNVSPLPLEQLGLGAEMQLRPAAMLELAVDLHPKRHLVKSHHACIAFEGIDLWHPRWTRNVIYVVRDPRDVACSVSDHFGLTLSEAVDFLGEDRVIGGDRNIHHFLTTWSKHVQSWLQAEKKSAFDVHVMRYEDMKENPEAEFTDALQHVLGEAPDADRVADAVRTCEFENLQQIEKQHGFPEQSDEHDRFFRKGQSGGWEEELPTDLANQIVEDHGEVMGDLGYL